MYNSQLVSNLPEPVEELRPKEPNRQWFLREYPISIDFLSIGCIVKIGCKSIPFQSVDEAMVEINAYVANPSEARDKWSKILD
jgi:hypothetical protein